eukprot:TRINITY_DN26448_c0_g1_i2.p1 TRINITY_DN26448_c0_g1~~TRINITY_DN26448_c0_g1_i2.p1  ORF type:complete len:205 (+),score=27.16 TRINITY_DN26448_c0_g1_i2:567-1181(+)
MEDVDDGQPEPLPYNPNNPQEVRAYYEKRRKRQLYTMLLVVWVFGIGALAIYYIRGFFGQPKFPYQTIFPMALILIVTGYVIWGLRRVYNGSYQPGALGWGRRSAPPPQPAVYRPALAPPAMQGEYDGPLAQPKVVVVQLGPDGRPMAPLMVNPAAARQPAPMQVASPSGKNAIPPPQVVGEIGSGKYPAPIPVQAQGGRQIIF